MDRRLIIPSMAVVILIASAIGVGYAYSSELSVETELSGSTTVEYCTLSAEIESPLKISSQSKNHWISSGGSGIDKQSSIIDLKYKSKTSDGGTVPAMLNIAVTISGLTVADGSPTSTILYVELENGTKSFKGSIPVNTSLDSTTYIISGIGPMECPIGNYGSYSISFHMETDVTCTITCDNISVEMNAFTVEVSS